MFLIDVAKLFLLMSLRRASMQRLLWGIDGCWLPVHPPWLDLFVRARHDDLDAVQRQIAEGRYDEIEKQSSYGRHMEKQKVTIWLQCASLMIASAMIAASTHSILYV